MKDALREDPAEASGLRPGPASAMALFWSFSNLALHGFGGVLPWAQRMLVEQNRWLSREDFLEILAFSQLLPGPNVCNLSLMVGDRFFGFRGAVAALLGMLVFPGCVIAVMALCYDQFAQQAQVRGALLGMSAAAAGLILSTGLKLALSYRGRWLWLAPGVGALMAIGLLRRPMLETLLWLVPLSVGAAWWQVRRESARGALAGGQTKRGAS